MIFPNETPSQGTLFGNFMINALKINTSELPEKEKQNKALPYYMPSDK